MEFLAEDFLDEEMSMMTIFESFCQITQKSVLEDNAVLEKWRVSFKRSGIRELFQDQNITKKAKMVLKCC